MPSSPSPGAPHGSNAPETPDETPDETPPDTPEWVGHWKVQRYGGSPPSVPTYYDATLDSWDVVKAEESGLYVAPHPILEVRGATIVLKDEGADDADRERWRAEVSDGTLRVTALTGEHEGAVGVAERIDEAPRDLAA